MQQTVACLSVHGILNLFVGCVYSTMFCLLVCILRQALMQPRLALNSLYSWGWTWTCDAPASTSWAQLYKYVPPTQLFSGSVCSIFKLKTLAPLYCPSFPSCLSQVSRAVVLTFVFMWPSVSNWTMLLSPLAPMLDGPCSLVHCNIACTFSALFSRLPSEEEARS